MMNPDHAQRIRAQQQHESDQAAIDELERRSAPLHWSVIAAVLAISLAAAVDGLTSHIQRYTALAAQEEALIQCLNGRMLKLGGAFVQCQVREVSLVAEVDHE